jgi:adenylosuccinate synthase
LDFVQLRYANRLSGFSSLAITKIDVLGGLKEIPICCQYQCGDKILTELPADAELFEKCRPIYEMMPGWDDITDDQFKEIVAKGYVALPENMKKYVERIEKEVGVPVEIVSVSPDRAGTIFK